MKAIKWLVIMLMVAMLTLTACKGKEEVTSEEGGSMPVQEETQAEEVVEESAPADAGEEAGTSEEAADEAGETPAETQEEAGTAGETTSVALLDDEAVLDHLGDYLLRPDDMPHKYLIPEDGEQHTSTLRLIQNLGEIEAKTYVKETGRIDGWWLRFERTSKADFAPGAFESSIELFQTVDGARLAMSPAYYSLYMDESRKYSQVEGGCDLGDQCEFFYSEKEDKATELIMAQYNVAFAYRNAFVWVMARGLQVDMDADYVLDAARMVYNKLLEAPIQ